MPFQKSLLTLAILYSASALADTDPVALLYQQKMRGFAPNISAASGVAPAAKVVINDDAINTDFQSTLNTGKEPRIVVAAALNKNPLACNLTGYLFEKGKGVKQNSKTAEAWFKSCAMTNPKAAYNLAVLYAKTNIEAALPYYKEAWDKLKKPEAYVQIIRYYRAKKDWVNEWEWLAKTEDRMIEASPSPLYYYWGQFYAEMIIEEHAPIKVMSRAKTAADKARISGNPHAALIVSDLIGKTASIENLVLACALETSATLMDRRFVVSKWRMQLNEAQRQECDSKVNSVYNHGMSVSEAKVLNFTDLVY